MLNVKSFLPILFVVLLASCNSDKVTCEMKEGIDLNKYNLKLKLTKMLALKYASEHYPKTKKTFFGIGFTDDYKAYLKRNLDNAEKETGRFYNQAVEKLANDTIIIEKIIPVSYAKEVNKCECEATMRITGTEIEDKFKYDITRDSKGDLVGHFSYSPPIKIDKEEYGFIEYSLRDVSYKNVDTDDETSSLTKEEKWSKFWSQIKEAFFAKDQETIIALSATNFFDGGGGGDADEWLEFIFKNDKRYNSVLTKLNKGVHEQKTSDGIPYKVTGENETGDLYFDYKNEKWTFGGVVGD